jgi:hypothetical protein
MWGEIPHRPTPTTHGQVERKALRRKVMTTDFRVLIQLAQTMGQAKKSGDEAAFSKAKAEHDAYKDLCLRADKMTLGVKYGAL